MQKRKINSINNILSLVKNYGSEIKKDLSALEIKNYTKKFKKFTATSDVNFNVGHGVIHGFIGPNGSGKTTTIKAIIGAYVVNEGSILINGNKAGSINANKLIGYIPERASFPKHLNTIQYLTAMGELSGLKSKDSKERGYQILEALELEKQAKRKPISFSSGMQKKILLAQSLLTNPSILILDEPAANLDPTARKELFDQLIFLRNQGKTILISSHILSELERIIDEATFIYYGEVIFTGKISEFSKEKSSVFIKSDNNKLLKEKLSKKWKVEGDEKTEIEISNLHKEDIDKIYNDIFKTKVRILSYRTNDLQSIYDKLANEAYLKNKGKQTLKGESIVKNKKGSK